MKQIIKILVISFLLIQCKKEDKRKTETAIKSNITYAKNFDIVNENGQKTLIIKKVFQNSEKQFKYILGNKNGLNELKIPVKKLVVTSTSHIPMIELLNAEKTLVGFPHTKYVSSKKTRNLIKNGHITELGSEQSINTEKLLELEPNLVVGFSLHPNNKLYNNIKKIGIPVVFNGEWLEETPLGRAEWIKFFGVLLGKEKEADSIFKSIEKSYLTTKKIATKTTKKKPTILSGSLFKDVWNVPAGESFMAKFLDDANLNYLWKNTKGTGSLQLNLESVLDKGKNADFWIGAGLYQTKEQLLNANKHYAEFTPVIKNNVYTIGNKRGETGGLIYFEIAPVRPDLVLKDLIKITQPELLPNYEFTFFEKMK